MASEPPYLIDDDSTPDDATASEADATSPPNDQPMASTPELSPDTAPGPTSAIPTPSGSGMAIPPPVASDSASIPAASFGPKSVRGGNMCMRVLSRTLQDLDVITGGTRAATYDEVDEYVERAIRTEQALERAALAAISGQWWKDIGSASDKTSGDRGLSQSGLESTAFLSTVNTQKSQTTTNAVSARQDSTGSASDDAGQAATGPTQLPDSVAPFGDYEGGKKVPGDFFQFTQDMLRTTVSHHDAANGIGRGYFKGDQSDIATAAEIAKSTIAGARLRNDIEDFQLVSSAQYFEDLAAEDSPYKDQYELVAKILRTKIALDTAQLDQKVGHEAQQYGIFFGQVARQVSAPVDAVMTIKDLADGKISPAEAAVTLATLGHGHLLGSVERMVARGAEKKIVEKAEETVDEPPSPKPDPEPDPKPRLATRENIIEDVQAELKTHLDAIRNIDPDAKVGFRGSLASGTKGEHKGNASFDPKDFDVDVLIVSDKLAGMIEKDSKGFRSGSKHKELKRIQTAVYQSLRSNPIFSGMRAGKFRFRIYSVDEMRRLRIRKSDDHSFNVIYTN